MAADSPNEASHRPRRVSKAGDLSVTITNRSQLRAVRRKPSGQRRRDSGWLLIPGKNPARRDPSQSSRKKKVSRQVGSKTSPENPSATVPGSKSAPCPNSCVRLKCHVVSSPANPGVPISVVYENGTGTGDGAAAQPPWLSGPRCGLRRRRPGGPARRHRENIDSINRSWAMAPVRAVPKARSTRSESRIGPCWQFHGRRASQGSGSGASPRFCS